VIVEVLPGRASLGRAAAETAATLLRDAIERRGRARIVAATGASQLDFLAALVRAPGIDWRRVELFHLDEYVALSADHPASFRRYLRERLVRPTGILHCHWLDGETDPEHTCESVGRRLSEARPDAAFVGIGENGHLAFNDPPADFEAASPYIVVSLAEASRRQQVGEGWFPTLDAVPRRAITMSIRQILMAHAIVCVVPESRKAAAVRACLEGELSPLAPASILRTHPAVSVFLDRDSAALLS
jgi:glucosamine-6-phosphate deaminase